MAESRSEKQQRKDLEAFRSAFQDTQPPSPSKVTNRSFTPQARRPDPSHSHDLSPRQGTLTSMGALVKRGHLMLPSFGALRTFGASHVPGPLPVAELSRCLQAQSLAFGRCQSRPHA